MIQAVPPTCPFCGRRKRAYSRITVEDLGADGTLARTSYDAVICRDCAFATVVRVQAAAEKQHSTH